MNGQIESINQIYVHKPDSNEDLWFDFSQFWSSQEIEEAMKDYTRNLHHLKEIYQSSLKVKLKGYLF